MSNNKIKCPKCDFEISIDEVLSHQLQEELRQEFEEKQKIKEVELSKIEKALTEKAQKIEAEKQDLASVINLQVEEKLKVEKQEIEKKAKEAANKESSQELDALKSVLKEKEENLDKLRKDQAEVIIEKQKLNDEKKAMELELLKKEESLSQQFEEKLKTQKLDIENKAKEEAIEKAQKEYSEKLENIKADGEERDRQNKELRDQISDLMKQLREMKSKDDQRDIEYQKKLMEEESIIKNKAKQEAVDESQLQIAQKEKQLEDLRKQLSEAQRKAEQGSQQSQGEVLELEIEEILKQKFPSDDIIPVAKGVNGADITHKVVDKFGQVCGTIVWETKRTKNWVDGWVPKLKDDQRNQKAEIAVLVTMVLPKEIKNFSVKEGVWVSDFNSVIGLATALRSGLINVNAVKQASVGKNEKMEFLYDYLSGVEFKQKIEAIVESFTAMKSDLEREKRAMTKIWETRDKQISRVVNNTVKMYGDLTGLMGKALPKIDLLELPGGESETDDPKLLF